MKMERDLGWDSSSDVHHLLQYPACYTYNPSAPPPATAANFSTHQPPDFNNNNIVNIHNNNYYSYENENEKEGQYLINNSSSSSIFTDPNHHLSMPSSVPNSLLSFFSTHGHGHEYDYPNHYHHHHLPLELDNSQSQPLLLIPQGQLQQQLPVPPSLHHHHHHHLPAPESDHSAAHFLDFFSAPLPQLHSLEHEHPPHSSSSSTRKLKLKRAHHQLLDLNLSDDSNNNSPQTLDSIVQQGCRFNSPPPPPPQSQSQSQSRLPRKQRRQTLAEKMRCLEGLMPWNKKMDTVSMLQQAYNYVHFLQAQVSILQSMPITSSFTAAAAAASHHPHFDHGGLGLGRLNRQQLLQVVVNSPAAQTLLYSQGFCIFAYEQLVSLKKAKESKATALQHFLFGGMPAN